MAGPGWKTAAARAAVLGTLLPFSAWAQGQTGTRVSPPVRAQVTQGPPTFRGAALVRYFCTATEHLPYGRTKPRARLFVSRIFVDYMAEHQRLERAFAEQIYAQVRDLNTRAFLPGCMSEFDHIPVEQTRGQRIQEFAPRWDIVELPWPAAQDAPPLRKPAPRRSR